MGEPWVGVDLDGTLAEYGEWKGAEYIGQPIHAVVEAVKRLLKDGHTVKIFTARAHLGAPAVNAIHEFLFRNGIPRLIVTATKDFDMLFLIDDRAVQVIPNKGIFVQDELKRVQKELDALRGRG